MRVFLLIVAAIALTLASSPAVDPCEPCIEAKPCFDESGCSFQTDLVWTGLYEQCTTDGAGPCAPCFPNSPCGGVVSVAASSEETPAEEVVEVAEEEATPVEGEGAMAEGENAEGEHAEGEHAEGEHAEGEHAEGEHAEGEHGEKEEKEENGCEEKDDSGYHLAVIMYFTVTMTVVLKIMELMSEKWSAVKYCAKKKLWEGSSAIFIGITMELIANTIEIIAIYGDSVDKTVKQVMVGIGLIGYTSLMFAISCVFLLLKKSDLYTKLFWALRFLLVSSVIVVVVLIGVWHSSEDADSSHRGGEFFHSNHDWVFFISVLGNFIIMLSIKEAREESPFVLGQFLLMLCLSVISIVVVNPDTDPADALKIVSVMYTLKALQLEPSLGMYLSGVEMLMENDEGEGEGEDAPETKELKAVRQDEDAVAGV